MNSLSMPRGKFGGTTASGGEAWPTQKLTKLPANVLPASPGCIRAPSLQWRGTPPGGSQPARRSPPGTASSNRLLCLAHPSPLLPGEERTVVSVDLGISRGYVRVQPEKAGPYLPDMRIVLAIQLIPCRNENGLHCLGRQVLLLLGCSLIPVCWFLRTRRIGWSALPTPFPDRGRDRRPVEVLAPSGSDPSSDTEMTLSSSLSEEMLNRPVDSLLGVPCGPASFLFWKGNCTSIFCR